MKITDPPPHNHAKTQLAGSFHAIERMPVPSGFDELMPKTIANATVDRLLHHAHVVLTAGDSIRLTQATAGKGVTPLTN